MKKISIGFFVIIISLIATVALSYSLSPMKEFSFTERNCLKEWSPKVFKGRVLYEVRNDGQIGYVYAKSDKTCSGLYYAVKFNCTKFPMVSWRWQVLQFPAKKPFNWKIDKHTDDYAVRFYIVFPSFFFPNSKAIEYVWDEWIPEGTIFSSPYTGNIKIIVVHAGTKDLGKWVKEERNIYEDYKKAFRKTPRLDVGAIAIMTNSDNSQSISEACYADIKVGYEKIEEKPQEKKFINRIKNIFSKPFWRKSEWQKKEE